MREVTNSPWRNLDWLIQSGLIVILLGGILYVVGNQFESGIYSAFGINGISPLVNPSVYMNLASNLTFILIALLLFTTFKDDIIWYSNKKERKKRDFIIPSIAIPVAFLFSVLAQYFFINDRSWEKALSRSWDSFGAYIFLTAISAFTLFMVIKFYRRDFIGKAKNVKPNLKLLHYVTEGVFLFILALGGLIGASSIAEHLGKQSLRNQQARIIITDPKNQKHIVVQEIGEKFLVVPLCSFEPLSAQKGKFSYITKNDEISLESKSADLEVVSSCK